MAWRQFRTPWTVMVYLAEGWHETTACRYDDESRDLRVHWPPGDVLRHRVVDASRYRPSQPGPMPEVLTTPTPGPEGEDRA